jgi:two-component system, chemotaxis family, protein-glutamate methylesterase/glutaminase
MPNTRVVVIGTSAGGLEALRTIVTALPQDFPAPICVVMHMAPQSPGVLHEILGRSGKLPAVNVTKPERIAPGHIYVAPPDHHLLLEPGRVKPTKGPKENRFRPAIDPLFRSAAQVYGPRAIGVILTGNLDDGTAGLRMVKQLGGIAVVQDPDDALYPSMPASALHNVDVDHRVALADVAPLLIELTATPREAPGEITVPDDLDVEVNIAKEVHPVDAGLERIGTPSNYACPECHGVLLQMKAEGLIRFRCHTGHAYSLESLMADVDDGIDDALWNAIRALEEARLLMQGLEQQLSTLAHDGTNGALARRADETRHHSDALRRIASERERWKPKSAASPETARNA